MGAGTSTLSTRKHSHSQRRRVRQLLRSLSSLLRLLRGCAGQASHSQPNAYPRSGWRADLVGSRVCSSGTTAGSIQLATTAALSDMYEPNQYVMNCGIVDPTAGPIRFSSLSVATSTTETQSSFSSVTLLVATWTSAALVATLSPSSDLHITPQIYISYEICGARRCSILHRQGGNTVPPLPIDLNSENGDWRRRL